MKWKSLYWTSGAGFVIAGLKRPMALWSRRLWNPVDTGQWVELADKIVSLFLKDSRKFVKPHFFEFSFYVIEKPLASYWIKALTTLRKSFSTNYTINVSQCNLLLLDTRSSHVLASIAVYGLKNIFSKTGMTSVGASLPIITNTHI